MYKKVVLIKTAVFSLALSLLTFSMTLGSSVTAQEAHPVPLSSIPKTEAYMPQNRVAPIYPENALKFLIKGSVLLEMTVAQDGHVIDDSIRVVTSDPKGVFEQASIDAAKQFRYAPQTLNGKPVDVSGVRYRFTYDVAR